MQFLVSKLCKELPSAAHIKYADMSSGLRLQYEKLNKRFCFT